MMVVIGDQLGSCKWEGQIYIGNCIGIYLQFVLGFCIYLLPLFWIILTRWRQKAKFRTGARSSHEARAGAAGTSADPPHHHSQWALGYVFWKQWRQHKHLNCRARCVCSVIVLLNPHVSSISSICLHCWFVVCYTKISIDFLYYATMWGTI